MSQPENLGSFFKEGKPLVSEYLETRLEIFRLKAVRLISKSAGYLIWVLVSLLLILLILIFSGVVLAFWLSALTGSYIWGFGITALVMVLVFLVLTLFRKALFVNPIIRAIIRKTGDSDDEEDE